MKTLILRGLWAEAEKEGSSNIEILNQGRNFVGCEVIENIYMLVDPSCPNRTEPGRREKGRLLVFRGKNEIKALAQRTFLHSKLWPYS